MQTQNMTPLAAPQVIRRHNRDLVQSSAIRRRRQPYDIHHRSPQRALAARALQATTPQKPRKMDEATVELMKYLKNGEEGLAENLAKMRDFQMDFTVYHPKEVSMRAFNFFQKRFFSDKLRDKVELAFGKLGLEISGQTHIKWHIGNSRVLIRLNSDLLYPLFRRVHHQKQARDHLYATLLHHMIHAYFLVRCGAPDPNKDADGRLRHENHFGAIMYKIREISAKYGDPLPIDFAHSIPRKRMWTNTARQIELLATHVNRRVQPNDRHHCTECTSTLDPIEEKIVTKWYKNRCYQSVNPDIYEFDAGGELTSTPLNHIHDKKSDWIELFWAKKTLKVDKICLKFLSSPFAKKFTNENRRVDIPKVPERTARALWTFLVTGSYGPDLSVTHDGSRGPALIMGLDPKWNPYIENEVRVHKLATKLQFDELRRCAFRRLMSMHVTYEDPIPVFQRIYNVDDGGRGSVHEELRKWSVAFMERHADHLLTGQNIIDFSNWKYLRDHAGFQYCLENGGEALAADFRKAEASLRKRSMGITKEVEELHQAAQFPGNAYLAPRVQGHGHMYANPEGLPPPPPPPASSMAVGHHIPQVAFPMPLIPAAIDHYEEWRGRSRSRSFSP